MIGQAQDTDPQVDPGVLGHVALAPQQSIEGAGHVQRNADRATPRPTASHRLCTAWWAARPCSPAPMRRATAEVVP